MERRQVKVSAPRLADDIAGHVAECGRNFDSGCSHPARESFARAKVGLDEALRVAAERIHVEAFD